jgi:hypothetical protein
MIKRAVAINPRERSIVLLFSGLYSLLNKLPQQYPIAIMPIHGIAG